jgi:hypothetical protein
VARVAENRDILPAIQRAAEMVKATASDMDERERLHFVFEALLREFPDLDGLTADCIVRELIVRWKRGVAI